MPRQGFISCEIEAFDDIARLMITVGDLPKSSLGQSIGPLTIN